MEPENCPFCECSMIQEEVEFHYNGSGPPPSYAVICGSCGAQGPLAFGRERGDHAGARDSAIAAWSRRAPADSDDDARRAMR